MSTPRTVPAHLFAALLAGGAGLAAQQELPDDRAVGAKAVTVDACKKWLSTLASPEFGGRGTGQDGFRRAADFVRDQFQALGLEPGAGDGSWFQNLPWTKVEPDVEKAQLVFRRDGREVAVPGTRLSGQVSRALEASGDVVLLTSTSGLDEVDLAGKVVVVVQDGEGDDARSTMRAMRALQGKNAAAVMTARAKPGTARLVGSSASAGRNRAMRSGRVVPTVVGFGGEDLLALLDLAGLAELPKTGNAHALPVAASVAVPVVESAAPACNVVGILRGADPARATEYVVVGSHLDHLGRSGSRFFPGADDDASGTTGVLAVATMLAKDTTRPARSVLFVCFCGEEMGLLGSRHFAEDPPIPLEAIVGELQMDMIGRCEEEAQDGPRRVNVGEKAEDNRNSLHLVGTQKLSPQLHELCLQKNATAGFDLEWDQESLFDRSDHANFARMGVPIAFFFTGLHRDYHQTTDTPDKIDYEKLLRVATYVRDIAFELAQQQGRPHVDPELWSKFPRKRRDQPAAPLSTGEAARDGGR
jgi:hypothetical protein